MYSLCFIVIFLYQNMLLLIKKIAVINKTLAQSSILTLKDS